MRGVLLVCGTLMMSACGVKERDNGSTSGAFSDSASVVAEVDTLMNSLVEYQLAGRFDDFNSRYTSSEEGTAATDGAFFPSMMEFLDHMQPVFESIDSVPSFEWLHYKVYALSDRSAVFAGQYREMVGMAGADPTAVVGNFTVLLMKNGPDWEILHVHSSHLR